MFSMGTPNYLIFKYSHRNIEKQWSVYVIGAKKKKVMALEYSSL